MVPSDSRGFVIPFLLIFFRKGNTFWELRLRRSSLSSFFLFAKLV
jgi:hypothetical protein